MMTGTSACASSGAWEPVMTWRKDYHEVQSSSNRSIASEDVQQPDHASAADVERSLFHEEEHGEASGNVPDHRTS